MGVMSVTGARRTEQMICCAQSGVEALGCALLASSTLFCDHKDWFGILSVWLSSFPQMHCFAFAFREGNTHPSDHFQKEKGFFFFFYSERQIHVSSLSGDLLKLLKETAEWNATCVAWIVNRCWKDDAGGSWAGVTLSGRVLGAPVHQCFCSLGI